MSSVVFLHPHCQNRNVASARVNAVLPAKYLLSKGYDVSIVATFIEVEAKRPDIVIVMSADQTQAALDLRNRVPNLKVVMFQSDGPVTSDDSLDSVNAIVLDCEYLVEKIPARFLHKTVTIPDTLEVLRRPPHRRLQRPLKLVWVGAGGNYFFAETVISALRDYGWDVKTICDGSNATVQWDLNTVDSEIAVCDVGIVPYPVNLSVASARTYDQFRYKDNNRMVLMQALGLPVVVSPLPVHLMYGKHNETCLFANTPDQWLDRIQYLNDNENGYNAIAESGNCQAWGYAAPEITGAQWEAVIAKALLPRA